MILPTELPLRKDANPVDYHHSFHFGHDKQEKHLY